MRIALLALLTAFFVYCVPAAYCQTALDRNRPIEIVAFGTSLTARGGWTEALQKAVENCLRRSVQVVKVALSGATTWWGVRSVEQVVSKRPDIVLIELYANDAALHRLVSIRQSRHNLAQIVKDLRKDLPNLRIIILAMNPFHGLRGFIRPRLQSYIEAHRSVALEEQIEFVDLRMLWLRLSKKNAPQQFQTALILCRNGQWRSRFQRWFNGLRPGHARTKLTV